MKPYIVFIGIGVIALVLWIVLSRYSKSEEQIEIGSINQLESLVTRLVNSKVEFSYLGIKPEGASAFFQLTASDEGAQVDFPLITDEQKGLGSAVEEVAKKNALVVYETIGTDGSKFLDIDVNGNPDRITETVKILVKGVFSSSDVDNYEYRHWGI